MLSYSVVSDSSVTRWTVVCQAPLSMGFSKQEYWSRLPFPSTGDLLNPGIKPGSPTSPALAGRFFMTEPSGKTLNINIHTSYFIIHYTYVYIIITLIFTISV